MWLTQLALYRDTAINAVNIYYRMKFRGDFIVCEIFFLKYFSLSDYIHTMGRKIIFKNKNWKSPFQIAIHMIWDPQQLPSTSSFTVCPLLLLNKLLHSWGLELPAGQYELEWLGHDLGGEILSCGMH